MSHVSLNLLSGVTLTEHAGAPKAKKACLALKDGVVVPSALPESIVAETTTPRKNTKCMNDMDIKFIMARLHACEDILCAPAAMTAMVPIGKRVHNKADLLRLFTFASGWDLQMLLDEEMEDLESFDNTLAEDTARRGHRLQFTTLPPDYDVDGLYTYNSKTNTAKHTFTLEEITLDESTLKSLPKNGQAYIYSNWSEQQAVLRVPGSTFKIFMRDLFKEQFPKKVATEVSSIARRKSRKAAEHRGSPSPIPRVFASERCVTPPAPLPK